MVNPRRAGDDDEGRAVIVLLLRRHSWNPGSTFGSHVYITIF